MHCRPPLTKYASPGTLRRDLGSTCKALLRECEKMFRDSDMDKKTVLQAIVDLKGHYRSFPLESQVWARSGHRRSPYRALVLFGLSSRTKDELLVETCLRFFQEFPNPRELLDCWPHLRATMASVVRKGQVPFIDSLVSKLQESSGSVPEDRDGLMAITGVGEKIAECVAAYGWGQEALPLDGNCCRVIERLMGLSSTNQAANRSGSSSRANSRSAEVLRRWLKSIYVEHREWMTALGVAMIDVHELLRLHGQTLCGRRPECARCPVSGCRSRRQQYSKTSEPGIDESFWENWRELLLELPHSSGLQD